MTASCDSEAPSRAQKSSKNLIAELLSGSSSVGFSSSLLSTKRLKPSVPTAERTAFVVQKDLTFQQRAFAPPNPVPSPESFHLQLQSVNVALCTSAKY